jgi:HK97 gp10 family phage protein
LAEFQHITGLREFLSALDQLPKNIAKNVLRGSVRAGAVVLQKEAISLAPVFTGTQDKRPDPGLLKRAIYQKQIPERSNDLQQTFFVGVKHGKNITVKVKGNKVNADAYYWTWLEFGHFFVPPPPKGANGKNSQTQKVTREKAKTGSMTIWVEPHPFLRPAFAVAKGRAIQAMVDYMEKRIPLEAQKLGLVMK